MYATEQVAPSNHGEYKAANSNSLQSTVHVPNLEKFF